MSNYQSGYSQVLIPLILLVGILVGVLLVKQTQVFKPQAAGITKMHISEAYCDGLTPVTTLVWPSHPNTQEFQVYRDEVLLTTVTGTTYTDRSGQVDTSYYYRVYAKVTNPESMGIVAIETPKCVSGIGSCTGSGGICLENHSWDLSGNNCSGGGTHIGQLDCPGDYPYCFKGTTCIETCLGQGGSCLNAQNIDKAGNVCTGGSLLGKYDCPDDRPFCKKGSACVVQSSPTATLTPGPTASPAIQCTSQTGTCLDRFNKDDKGSLCTGGTHLGILGCPDSRPYCYRDLTCQTPSPSVQIKIGDTDSDGDVDIFDYNLVLGDFGKTNDPNTKADLDNDNDVDIFDYNLVVTNFGK